MTALSAAGMRAIFGLERVRALLDSDDGGVHRAPAPGLQDDHVQLCCGSTVKKRLEKEKITTQSSVHCCQSFGPPGVFSISTQR